MVWRTIIREQYPRACPIHECTQHIVADLEPHGITPDNTLLATCFCRDELNTATAETFTEVWGSRFNLAGLGGYPAAGRTGLSACCSHVPDGGNLLLAYGPHIGVNETGKLGITRRPGRGHESSCCGALVGLCKKLSTSRNYIVMHDDLDEEMNALERALLPHAQGVLDHPEPVLALTDVAFDVIDRQIHRLISACPIDGKVVLIGGTVINTPLAWEDWFVPRRAEIFQHGRKLNDQPWWRMVRSQ